MPASSSENPVDEDASVVAELPETPIEEEKIGEVALDVEETEAPPVLVEEATPPEEEAAAAAIESKASPTVEEKEVVVVAPEVEPMKYLLKRHLTTLIVKRLKHL